MIYLNRFNESYCSINDVLLKLEPYLTKKGVYTKYLVNLKIVSNYLEIELDVAGAFSGGKSERDKIKIFLRKNGFNYFGIGCNIRTIENDSDKEIIINYINK